MTKLSSINSGPVKIVYTALSRYNAYMKHHVNIFVLNQEYVPINPFMNFEYFLLDTVPRDQIRRANNSYIYVAQEVWTFGQIADGVLKEIKIARKLGKVVRHFSLGNTLDSICQIDEIALEYEKGVEHVDQGIKKSSKATSNGKCPTI